MNDKIERLTDTHWRNMDPWECCEQDHYCKRGYHEAGGCLHGCPVPKLYARLAQYEDTGLTVEQVKGMAASVDNSPQNGQRIGKKIIKNRTGYVKSWENVSEGYGLYRKERHICENNPVGYCSECGKRLCSRFENYCPNCGAKMEKEWDGICNSQKPK